MQIISLTNLADSGLEDNDSTSAIATPEIESELVTIPSTACND